MNDTNIVEHVKRTKTLVFTVTTGRSGTKYLTALLSGIAGVSAYHEPQPDIASYMRRCQKQPETAFAFSASCSGLRPDMMLSAGVAELVDALDLGSSDESCGGSSPSARTKR